MNNKLSLFELTREQLDLISLIENSEETETGEDLYLQAGLEINRLDYADKAADYLAVIRHKENDLLRAKEAEEQIKVFKARAQRVIDRLKTNLTSAAVVFGPLETGFHKISLRASEETVITDMEKIPEKFLDRKVVISANKTKIKSAIKEGEEVPGAFVKKNQNLQIR